MPSPTTELSSPREKLLEAAFDVFAERGYSGTSTREICRRAGANGAALNYHWGSKDELWLAVADRCGEFFLETLTRSLDSSLAPAELIERIIGALFDALALDPRPIRIVMWATMHAEAMDYDATARAFDPVVRLAIQTLLAMQEAGVVAAEVDVEVAVPLLHGQIVYAFADRAGHRRFYGKDLSDPDHAARFRAEVMRTFRLVLGLTSTTATEIST